MSLNKEIAAIMKEYGFWLKRATNHLVWTDGQSVVVTAKTPSDYRAIANIRARAKRAYLRQKKVS